MSAFIVDARSISEWQDCKRRYVLARDWRVVKWRPKTLFDGCLRRAIAQMSKGVHVEQVAMEARTLFMGSAANPGLEVVGIDPYQVSMDYCAMIDTILRALAKTTLMSLHDVKPIPLNDWLTWNTTAHADDTGTLHRWITVDGWGEGDLARELHSWYVMGDIAVNRVPMVLHIIEIGQIRNGRRASPWARAYKHPSLMNINRIRFRRTSGAEMGGEWKPYYLADHREFDVDTWTEIMWKEGAAQERLRSLNVACPSDEVCSDTRSQIVQEVSEMSTVGGHWNSLPMSRNHCDTYVPCPFQAACYSKQGVDIRSIGLYQSRAPERVAV